MEWHLSYFWGQLRNQLALIGYFTFWLVCLMLPIPSYQQQHVTDICDHGAIDASAHLIFQDGIERYFISNEHHYWFLNITDDKPDVESAFKIPYGFKPDVAILKDTRNCPSGDHSLLLIQMKNIADTNEAEWLTLEMKIGNWNDNKTGPIFWNQVNKIAHCDLEAHVCTTTDDYFATMSFDFKKKLDSAFGTIGKTAYFIQGQQMFKTVYKTECISKPYMEVISYPAVNIGTDTTAALSTSYDNQVTVTLFDYDLHTQFNMSSINDVTLALEQIESAKWIDNAHYFIKQCPRLDSIFDFLFMDIFSGSKRHRFIKKVVVISSASTIICLIILIISIILWNCLKKPKSKTKPDEKIGSETNEEQLIEQSIIIEVKAGENGEKTLLQTSC